MSNTGVHVMTLTLFRCADTDGMLTPGVRLVCQNMNFDVLNVFLSFDHSSVMKDSGLASKNVYSQHFPTL